MKQLIIILLIFLSSCVKITYSDKITVTSEIISKNYTQEKNEYKYHYGYSIIKGKFCWHFGNVNTPESYTVKIKFLDDTITRNDKGLYYRDSLLITYREVYRDSIFSHNEILSIQ